MITKLRAAKNSLLIKIFLTITALGLLGWNIPQLFSSATNSNYILKAGKSKITLPEYQILLNQWNLIIAKQYGLQRPLTIEEMEQMGLLDYVYNNTKAQLLLAEAARSQGLTVSSKAFVEFIQQNNLFKNNNGVFSRSRFENFLNQLQISANQYFAATKNEVLTKQLIYPLSDSLHVSDKILKALETGYTQKNNFAYYEITAEDYKKIAKPSEETLKEYFETTKYNFLSPEYRQLSYFIQDDTNQNLYAEINNARADGLTVPDLAKNFNFKLHSITIDKNGKNNKGIQITTPQEKSLLDKAFEIEEKDLYLPTTINMGNKTIWFQIEEIIEATPKAYDEVKSEVLVTWQKEQTQQKFFQQLQSLMPEIEKNESIEQFAKKHNQKLKYLNNVSFANTAEKADKNLSQEQLQYLTIMPVNKLLLIPDATGKKAIIIAKTETKKSTEHYNMSDEEKEKIRQAIKNNILNSLLKYYSNLYPIKEANN
ncbi:peptidylprolyl isomerase [Bartonella sp. DGB1]|uniref:peptidylprolyl isomerase n=1 Tax=Bartonella sp. DGB1 TaxID=3239807 RepID=UPI003524D277